MKGVLLKLLFIQYIYFQHFANTKFLLIIYLLVKEILCNKIRHR
jgi:hypothetical protein